MNNQKGFSLLELILVVGIIGAIALYKMQDEVNDLDTIRAKQLAKEIYQYNAAVLSYIGRHAGSEFDAPSGTLWLKSSDCGGIGMVDFLPCNFPAYTTLGKLNFDTNITIDPAGFTVATTTLDPLVLRNRKRSDLTGIAALHANSGSFSGMTKLTGIADLTFKSDPNTAVLKLIASTNQSGGFVGGLSWEELISASEFFEESPVTEEQKQAIAQVGDDFINDVKTIGIKAKDEGVSWGEVKDVLNGTATINVLNYDTLAAEQDTGNKFLDILMNK